MSRNETTMTVVWSYFGHDRGLPAREKLEDEHRYLLVCSEGIGKHVESVIGGAYSTPTAAVESYEWYSGVPEYLIDLCAPPAHAVVPLAIEVRVRGDRGCLADFGIDWEDGEVEDA